VARQHRIRWGLAAKLVVAAVVVFVGVSGLLIARATSELETDLVGAFESKGEAVALAMAAAAERSEKGDPLIVQNSIESNRRLHGVRYILVQDPSGAVYGSTFVGTPPSAILGANTIAPGEALGEAGVKIGSVSFNVNGEAEQAIDVAAPIARSTLGTVHVGMDRAVIESQVAKLRRSLLGWGALFAVFGIATMLLVVSVTVLRPVQYLTRVTGDILNRGDLTQQVRVSSSDELGRLATTFGKMVEKLREIPTTIQGSTKLLQSSVDKLNASVVEQSQTTTRQAAALQETQVTAEEIKQTSLVASQKADAVLRYTERAELVSKTGETAVENSLAALTAIRGEVDEIAKRIRELSERAIQIGNVTQTVKDLADQSNMLALNAAIEAVRSGEHGRGFAVVAREMRSLADQSIEGTNRVRELLEDIGAAIREAVIITGKGAERIDAGLDQVRTSGQTLSELSGIVKDNSSAVRQISAAVGQQNAGISQIFVAVSDQNRMMEDTIHRLAATEESVATLKQACDGLVRMVSQFQV
jgi:methyl-accepting chemotaxis protein